MTTAPRSSRSKGCRQCIERHVKCDESSQLCGQCARFGLPCSGPIHGPIILDMTEKVTKASRKSTARAKKSKGRKKNNDIITAFAENTDAFESSSPLSTHTSNQSSEDTESTVSTSTYQMDLECAAQRVQLQLTGLESLYDSDLFEQCFVSQFVELTASSRLGVNPNRPRSWIYSLPSFLENTSMLSVKYCIRAAALIFYAVANRNKSAEVDAVRWYLAALESHRSSLGIWSIDSRISSSPLPDSQDLCVPLLFFYFEIMKGTTSDAWVQHITAAIELLELRGAPNCRKGHEHGMFRSIRPYAAFNSILHNAPTNLDSQEWCAIPFEEQPKISFDFLIDILLSIPRQLGLPRGGNNIGGAFANICDLSENAKDNLKNETHTLLDKLYNWCWHFERANGVLVQPPASLAMRGGDYTHEPTSPPSSLVHIYPDTLTAATIAIYNTACLILQSVLLHLAASGPPCAPEISPIPRYRSSITSHSASILRVAEYLHWEHPFGGDTQRARFSIQIVLWLGVDEEHCAKASRIIEGWGDKDEEISVEKVFQ